MTIDIARLVRVKISDAEVRKIVRAVGERTRGRDLSIAFVGPKRMRELNRTYHGEDRVTDVLAFPFETIGHKNDRTIGRRPKNFHGPTVLKSYSSKVLAVDCGEIVICPLHVRAQAKRAGEPFRRELTRVLVHGTLHLLGHDHARPRDAARMFALQEAIVRGIRRER